MPLLFVPKGRGFFLWKIYFEFKEMIELKKAKLNKQKSPETKAFSLYFYAPCMNL